MSFPCFGLYFVHTSFLTYFHLFFCNHDTTFLHTQKVLLDQLSSNTSSKISLGKTLISIESNPEMDGIMCKFQDGTTQGPFDLVVGCDGINSAVKEFVERGEILNKDEKRSSSIYSGIRIQYAVEDNSDDDDVEKNDETNKTDDSAELVQYFGKGAYGLAGIYGSGKGKKPIKGAFLISCDEEYIGPFKKTSKNDEEGHDKIEKIKETTEATENADWTRDDQSLGDVMAKCINDSGVPKSQLAPIVENSDQYFELGVYFHNPLSLNGWSRTVKDSGGRYAVLAGDAAHAMPPFLGQGANQVKNQIAIIFLNNSSFIRFPKIFSLLSILYLSIGDPGCVLSCIKSF